MISRKKIDVKPIKNRDYFNKKETYEQKKRYKMIG